MSKVALLAKPSSLAGIAAAIPTVLADLAKLQNPVLAAAVVADVLAVISPFGINVGTTGPVITNALVAVGLVDAAVEKFIASLKKPTPAPAPVAGK